MKVVIFGASGGTGRELLKQALERDHQIIAFVRNPDKIADIKTSDMGIHKQLKMQFLNKMQ